MDWIWNLREREELRWVLLEVAIIELLGKECVFLSFLFVLF